MHLGQCVKASSTSTIRMRCGTLPFAASLSCRARSRTIRPLPLTRSVSPPGYDEEEPHLGMLEQILERVGPKIARPVRYRESLVVQYGNESGRIALGRDIEPAVRSSRRHHHEGRRADEPPA